MGERGNYGVFHSVGTEVILNVDIPFPFVKGKKLGQKENFVLGGFIYPVGKIEFLKIAKIIFQILRIKAHIH